MQTLDHPHIVRHHYNFLDQETLIIIMEYCEEGDLSQHIANIHSKNQSFPEDLILNWFV